MKKLIFIGALVLVANVVFAQQYTPSVEQSKVHFVIKNFSIKTGGDFKGIKGSIVFDPKSLSASKFNVSVDASTVNTDNNMRDKHLRKPEYFDVETYPLISFVSTKIIATTLPGRYFVVGNLTIKKVTKVVEFGFTATPKATGYQFKGEFEINRRDYGVGGGSFSLADSLKVELDIVANK